MADVGTQIRSASQISEKTSEFFKKELGGLLYAVAVSPIACSISALLANLNSSSPRFLASSASTASSRLISSFVTIGLLSPFSFAATTSRLAFAACLVCKYPQTALAALVPSLRAIPTRPSLALRDQPPTNTPSRVDSKERPSIGKRGLTTTHHNIK